MHNSGEKVHDLQHALEHAAKVMVDWVTALQGSRVVRHIIALVVTFMWAAYISWPAPGLGLGLSGLWWTGTG